MMDDVVWRDEEERTVAAIVIFFSLIVPVNFVVNIHFCFHLKWLERSIVIISKCLEFILFSNYLYVT